MHREAAVSARGYNISVATRTRPPDEPARFLFVKSAVDGAMLVDL
jgi:hypothetical protein